MARKTKTEKELRTLAQKRTAENNTFRDNARAAALEEAKTTKRRLPK